MGNAQHVPSRTTPGRSLPYHEASGVWFLPAERRCRASRRRVGTPRQPARAPRFHPPLAKPPRLCEATRALLGFRLARVSSWRSCSRSADANFMLCVSKALCECEASRRSLSSSATSAARRDASLSPMFRATFSSSSNCLFFCVAWSSCCLACDCKRKVSVLYGQTVLGFIGKCNTYLPELGA